MIIRNEQPSDVDAISHLTEVAFAQHPFSSHTEQFIINGLRAADALTLSLVAEVDGQVVGHVAFSPVSISDGSSDWYGLGPVSVLPAFQNQGIGSALIREGLTRLQSLGAKGCVLVGELDFYQRFGFAHQPELVLADIPPDYFLALSFEDRPVQGTVVFHKAFFATN